MWTSAGRAVLFWTITQSVLLCAHGLDLEQPSEDDPDKVNLALTLKVDDEPVLRRLFGNLDRAVTIGDLRTALRLSSLPAPGTAVAREEDAENSRLQVAIIADATDEELKDDDVTLSALLDQQQQRRTKTPEERTYKNLGDRKEGKLSPFQQGFLQSLSAAPPVEEKNTVKLTTSMKSTPPPFTKDFWKKIFSTSNFFRFPEKGNRKVFKPRFCFCPLVKDPVCGIDSVTYANECLLRCKQVRLKHAGKCRTTNEGDESSERPDGSDERPESPKSPEKPDNPSEFPEKPDTSGDFPEKPDESGEPPETPGSSGESSEGADEDFCLCPPIDQPVCGTDGKTYANICTLACLEVSLAHDGKCRNEEPEKTPDLEPGCRCTHKFEPVCGTDNKTYRNSCLLKCANVELKHAGPCTVDELCETCNCTKEIDPVCGRDGDTHRNKCHLHCKGVDFKHSGPCQAIEKHCACTYEYKPVCGVDGQTYGNKCLLNCSGIHLAHEGECETGVSRGKACSCPSEYAPVCGVDGITYRNRCQLNCANVRLALMGKCSDQTCKCSEEYDPVCGINGITYRNPCYMSCDRVSLAHNGVCRQGSTELQSAARALSSVTLEDSDDEFACMGCPVTYNPVCGEDGKTYKNECELNCKGVAFAYSGECDPSKKPCGACPRQWEPLCSTELLTYANSCLQECDNGVLKHEGRCTKKERRVRASKFPACVCERVFELVCGVDGETYANRCEMECKGVRLFHVGQCDFKDVTRESGALSPSGDSAAQRKTICPCPTREEPVCGRDGKTYQNECLMRCAGAALRHSGACSGTKQPEWLKPGLKCSCPLVYDPICGGDGKTYDNLCQAKCHGVVPKHRGKCHHVPPAERDPPVAESVPEVSCGCFRILDPVCGTDRKTYDNRCLLKCHGIPFLHYGPCAESHQPDDPCRDLIDPVCGTNDKTYTNDCLRHRSGAILKFRRPCSETDEDIVCYCSRESDPVCGRDGKTYFNECEMECKGVELDHRGMCMCPCTRELDPVCGNDGTTYNNPCLMKCHGVALLYYGRCADGGATSKSCPELTDPVCGTNGKTYKNDCLRYREGATLRTREPCEDTQERICVCPRNLDLVCGRDGETYNNRCLLECHDVDFLYYGECAAGGMDSSSCPEITDPVCGTNGTTYQNDCLRYRDKASLRKRDSCENIATLTPAAPRLCPCPRHLDLVCGSDGVTYSNKCLMDCHGAAMRHYGRCPEGGAVSSSCPDLEDPVCGTNGKTYKNDCLRYKGGTSLRVRKPCSSDIALLPAKTRSTCRCHQEINLICGSDGETYKNKCWMECHGVEFLHYGRCEEGEPSTACSSIMEHVCGTDNETYMNDCLRHQAGVALLTVGRCPQRNTTALTHSKLGEPCRCSDKSHPVCGNDGRTYNNRCLLNCEGVTILYEGRCASPCPDVNAPVCGTDGKTYRNDCQRYQHRTTLRHQGLCPLSSLIISINDCNCPAAQNIVCGKDTNTYENQCLMDCANTELAHEGYCQETKITEVLKPIGMCRCGVDIDPVCGSDGMSYRNQCLMKCAGVELLYYGRCAGSDGESNSKCILQCVGMTAIYRGKCAAEEVISNACPDVSDPVCGTNGKTYRNDCLRHRDGAVLHSRGFCQLSRENSMVISIAGCSCPKQQKPVCGMDGRTYLSRCVMECARERLKYEEECRNVLLPVPEPPRLCPCPRVLDPVCGLNGRTYNNKCLLDCEGVALLYYGKCAEGGVCPETPDPVCSTEGITYRNDCLRHQGGATLSSRESCQFSQDRYIVALANCPCPSTFEPVCGKDGQTYINNCTMEFARIELSYEDICKKALPPTSVKPAPLCACPRILDPVCGTNRIAYANKCLMECENIALLYYGVCPQPGQAQNSCPQIIDPVCATNGRTYKNDCLRHFDGALLKQRGECSHNATETPAQDFFHYCVCPKIADPVCGHDANPYVNQCEMECRQVKFNHSGRCSKVFSSHVSAINQYPACTLEYVPVCGEDGKTYGNNCLLKAHNVALKSDGPCNEGSQALAEASANQTVCQCPRIYRPVCGEDANTYPNTCVLFCHNVGFKHDGKCGEDIVGKAAFKPKVCFCHPYYIPVCGQDGKTHLNACVSACYQVAVKHSGPCSKKGLVTLKGGADEMPACSCPRHYEPVCGQDGKTYRNACLMECHKIALERSGPCQGILSVTSGTRTGVSFCRCSRQRKPVCGQDGKTYLNACFLGCNRVALEHAGKCISNLDNSGSECPETSVPVCGQDGITYANSCSMARKGVKLVHGGPCGLADEVAAPASFPLQAPECNCSDHYLPVCGKNGLTYTNSCYLKCEHVQLEHYGVCGPPCHCGSHYMPVCGKDGHTYLNKCLLQCAGVPLYNYGTCVNLPCGCSLKYAPVCGVNGSTYMNNCTLECAGINIKHMGECIPDCVDRRWCNKTITPPCGCPRLYGPVCGEDGLAHLNECTLDCADVALKHEGDCSAAIAVMPHTATKILHLCGCSPQVAPVCGDDGTTYSNECVLECAGITLKHPGKCSADLSESDCRCSLVSKPVCGQDGVTYQNECFSQCARAAISHLGECIPHPSIPGARPKDMKSACNCPQDYEPVCGKDFVTYLNLCTMQCAGIIGSYSGECKIPPCGCPHYYAPACGTNGITYQNKCVLECAGVTLAHRGDCALMAHKPAALARRGFMYPIQKDIV